MSEKRILVADDDASVRTALTRHFESFGYHVDTAANYIDTRELIETNTYTLIVSDNGMPLGGESRPNRTCGLQLLAWTKLHGPNVQTPFVLNTGDDTDETKRLAAEFGGIYRYKTDAKPLAEFLKEFVTL